MNAAIDTRDLRGTRRGQQPAWLPPARRPSSDDGATVTFERVGCYDCGHQTFERYTDDPDNGMAQWHCTACEEVCREHEMLDGPARDLRAYLHERGHSNTADDAERDTINTDNLWSAAHLRRAALKFCDQHPSAIGSTPASKARSLFGSVNAAVAAATSRTR